MAASHCDVLDLFVIDPASQVPPFQQLHDAVIAAIAAKRLAPGAQLPTVRGLAAHTGLAANTVASAYRSLEAAGVVEGRGRAGTFVQLGVGGDPLETEARRIALDAARALRGIGIERDHAVALIAEAYAAASTR